MNNGHEQQRNGSTSTPGSPANPAAASTSRIQNLRHGGISRDSLNSNRPASPAPSGLSDDEQTEADEENDALAFEVEPGIDVKRSDFSDIYSKKQLDITVADWCSRKAKVRQGLSNEQFLNWLERPRPGWSKARWINMTGLNWHVFKTLALKYDLHPLAVEDCLHVFDSSARSKSDQYTHHLFIRLVFSQLGHPDAAHPDPEEDENLGGVSTVLDDEDIQKRQHAIFQKRVDKQGKQQQQGQGPTLKLTRPSATPLAASAPFRVSRTTGRASHSKPKHSMERVPTRTRSRRSRIPNVEKRKGSTGLEADSILSRAWTRLSGGSSQSTLPTSRSQAKKKDTRTLTAAHFESNEANIGFTTRDVAEDPFEDGPGNTVADDTDSGLSDSEDDAYFASKKVISKMTHHYRLPVRRQQLSVFLLNNNTILTIFSKDGSEIIPGVVARLKSKDTLLRNTEDASMLLQGLLDTCVDKSLDVIDAFKRKLDMLEGTSLVSPQISTVQHLHVMSQQLSQMRGAVVPLQNLISTLRSGEEDRMLMSAAGKQGGSQMSLNSLPSFISLTTRLYLKDVLDHTDSVLSSLDLLASNTEALVGYIFNSINFSSNETMKSLTFVTIIYLPLSFGAGYAGMNYTSFPGVTGEDDTYANFFKIFVPLTIATIVLIALPDIVRFFRTIWRKYQHAKFTKERYEHRRRLRKML